METMALSWRVDGASIIEDPQFQACLRGGVKDEGKRDRCVGQEA